MRPTRTPAITAGIIGTSLALTLTACGGGHPASTTQASSGGGQLKLTQQLPPATGAVERVTWNLPYEPASLDPIKTQVFADAPVTSNMCESLLKVQPDLSIAPNLAVSYTHVNPLTWKYKLRPGVTFWDGSPMTAQDVVASLERNLDPKLGSYWSLEYQNVKKITATGSDEVTISFAKPDGLLNYALSSSAGAISKASALQKAGPDYGTAKTGLMCTGPFKFQSWKPGDQIDLVRNDTYWDAKAKPKVANLVFKFISDASTVSSALTTGQVDGMYQVPAAAIPQLRAGGAGTFSLGASTASLDVFPTERKGPLHDAKVRQALYFALDRAAVASGVYSGAAQPAKSFVNPGVGYGADVFNAYFATRPPAKVDLAKAKDLIKQASADVTTPMQLATSPDPALVTVANAIAAAGQSLGLSIKVVTLTPAETDELYFDPKLRDKFDAFLNVQWTPLTDPLEQLAFVTKAAFTNYGQYDNPTFEKLFDAANAVDDPTKRAEAAVAALKVVDEDLPWIPVVSLPVTSYVSNKLGGIPTSWAFLYGQWAAGLGSR